MRNHLCAGLIIFGYTLSGATPSASPPASAEAQPPRTNLTAVVDPIAVPVADGVRIRVGAHNSGPLPITAPEGQPAVRVSLVIDHCCLLIAQVKSLGDCQIGYSYPPNWPTIPAEPRSFDCDSTDTWPVGRTHWQSFVFPSLSSLADGVSVAVSGYVQDPNDRDNRRDVVVHLAQPGSSLPVTGTRTIFIGGAGLALVVIGIVAIWLGRRYAVSRGTHR